MSLTLKQKVIKILNPISLPVFLLYLKIFKPNTYGVKVIIEHDGKFLLIRNSYMDIKTGHLLEEELIKAKQPNLQPPEKQKRRPI